MKMDIKLTEDGCYRPETLIINGELASMKLFLDKHDYNWQSTASGNVLFYRTEAGKEYRVPQAQLMAMKKGEKTMMKYTVKSEYLSSWGSETTQHTVITEEDLLRFSKDWELPVNLLRKQLIPYTGKWYAVQTSREDDWGTGSYDMFEAIDMARKQRRYYPGTLVAVIENDTCTAEITDF